jgi:predicted nucleic acid-binding protein
LNRVAVDTNIIVRLFVEDDPIQTKKAATLLTQNYILISTSVILETAWVLGKFYAFSSAEIAAALKKLASIKTVQISDYLAFDDFLKMIDNGMDVADAVHLASAGDADWFATFDKEFVKTAKGSRLPVRQP